MSWKCNCEVDVQWPRHLLSNANALCYFWFGFTCNSWLSEGVGVAIIYQYMMYRWMILHVIVFQTKTIPSKTMLYFGKLCVSAMMTLSQKNITIHIWNHRVVKVYMFERLPQKITTPGVQNFRIVNICVMCGWMCHRILEHFVSALSSSETTASFRFTDDEHAAFVFWTS